MFNGDGRTLGFFEFDRGGGRYGADASGRFCRTLIGAGSGWTGERVLSSSVRRWVLNLTHGISEPLRLFQNPALRYWAHLPCGHAGWRYRDWL
jgi:hypothetical protein